MSLHLVAEPDYTGAEGLAQLRELQRALISAQNAEDWVRVRELDRACAHLVEKVIAANRSDPSTLVQALSELKGVYASLIDRCQREVSSMAL